MATAEAWTTAESDPPLRPSAKTMYGTPPAEFETATCSGARLGAVAWVVIELPTGNCETASFLAAPIKRVSLAATEALWGKVNACNITGVSVLTSSSDMVAGNVAFRPANVEYDADVVKGRDTVDDCDLLEACSWASVFASELPTESMVWKAEGPVSAEDASAATAPTIAPCDNVAAGTDPIADSIWVTKG